MPLVSGARPAAILLAALTAVSVARAQVASPVPARDSSTVPALQVLVGPPASELAAVVARFDADRNALAQRYDAFDSPAQRTRMRAFYTAWKAQLGELDFEKLGQEGRVDYVLLDHTLTHELAVLDRQDKMRREMAPLIPFADRLLALEDRRRDLLPADPRVAARTLAEAAKQVDSLRAVYDQAGAAAGARPASGASRKAPTAPTVSKTVANRAAEALDRIRSAMGSWYKFYDGYDPVFSWWLKDPYAKLNDALTAYARTLREKIVGTRPSAAPVAGAERGMAAGAGEPIIGDPIGLDGLNAELAQEMLPYSPQELIGIAEREYAFSLGEAKKAAKEMGFGDDWKAAMEKVKNTYVDPGDQPELIRGLARQAEAFFDRHDWVTIPPLAREDWRMEMLSPERQRVSPFFLGGELILVSYPTAEMSEDEKLMSLRGNNPHFSHATVFHELNPGHHLQQFMETRYNPHRQLFHTPFWSEGQSLYWEMFLWDHGFQQSPEDRLGALFWRMHRSARIIFSLNFHLGKMTPAQAIDFLVDSVDFEGANAEAEVRRSFNGSYSPLYQVAYMIGGLQLRALHHELVDANRMSDREFHDAVLQGGPMPIAMVRARLEHTPLTRQGAPPWRFADRLPPPVPAPVPVR